MSEHAIRTVVVLGPTATGKTRLAVQLARDFGGEIVSADSRQVYRGLDLGTGKDLDEYGTGESRIPCHLIDVAEPTDEYHLFRFVADAGAALRDIAARDGLPIIAGGTALYLNALLDRYLLEGGQPDPALRQQLRDKPAAELAELLRQEDPDLAARTDTTQHKRLVRAIEIARFKRQNPQAKPCRAPPLAALLIAPHFPRAEVHRRIEKRLDERLDAGLLDEVKQLHDQGVPWERLEFLGLEYRYVALFLQQKLSHEQMRDTLLAKIRRLCRAQDIWFRKMEREGKLIHWIPRGDAAQAAALVRQFIAHQPIPPPTLRLMDTLYGPKT